MEICKTPALTVYPCEDFPSKTTRSVYYLEKTKQSQISDPKFDKTSVCEEVQHAKPYRKPWIYQVSQLFLMVFFLPLVAAECRRVTQDGCKNLVLKFLILNFIL